MRGYPQWRWDLDEVFVEVNGKLCCLWRAVDHEGEVLEAVATAKQHEAAALELLKRIVKRYGLLAGSSPMGFGHIRRR
jgi:putative transposase